MVILILKTLGELAGGAFAAIVLTGLFWTALKVLRHPEWGPVALCVGGLALFGDRIGSSPFLQTAFLFSGLFAVAGWRQGRAWRADHPRSLPVSGERPDV